MTSTSGSPALADILAMALQCHRAGQLVEAVKGYRAALAISPDQAQIHNNLGVALRDLGRSEEAVFSYRRALEIQPNFFQVYSNLGTALRDLGRLEDSVASHRRALEIDPTLHRPTIISLTRYANSAG